ncbi:hypothetical protein [Hymenobacter convexus]|uniref:hypothetical protein n=1 Tax=Hymenobacter sp. CA1UV-4 TaxID=3063782 RepID=UPI0027130A14|nr:hypothetical protein [Hymenobacter sp. CA1UV-4]MDO7853175.1 hypothetical protein [Hymenobacter sp. CA1UV-4]
MEPNDTLVAFTSLSEGMQSAVAKTIKDEMEGRTGIQTKGVGEWVRVMTLGATQLLINYATRKMNVEPQSKVVLELLVRQYLLVGVKAPQS